MKTLLIWITVLVCATAWAYSPEPVKASAEETALTAALNAAVRDSAKLQIAREALERNPEDIPLGRVAQDIILKQMENAEDYFKKRALSSESIAAHYLNGRASGDTTIMAVEALWILEHDPKNFWGWLLWASAEWYKSKPDSAIVRSRFTAAIEADPSRPEGYLNLGYFFQDEERWPEAREVLDAGALADPSHKGIRDARLTTYAELRDADSFFSLMKGVVPDISIEADLPKANGTGRFTTADLRGHSTVLEYWAYT